MRLFPPALLLAIPGVLLAQRNYTPADIREGGRLFRANCVLCHGPDGDHVPGIDLGHGRFRQTYSQQALIKIIQEGIPGTGMPTNNLRDFEAEIVLAYLRSIGAAGQAVSGKGDATRGKTLFEGTGGCLKCHRVGANGSRVGPDLSDIGAIRRTTEIERALLEPDEEILPQNRYYHAVTKQGGAVHGRLLNVDTFTVQILDSSEKLVSLDRANLRESGFDAHSPMPSYRGRLSSQEIEDVVAYLASLKGL